MNKRTRQGATAYIWRYQVKPEKIDAFREAYGPKGVWFAFFSQSPAYLGTDLYEDEKTPGWFVTVDYFADAKARPALVAQAQAAFDEIDRVWEAVTLEETFIGEMTVTTAE